jgi:hypothetical protein
MEFDLAGVARVIWQLRSRIDDSGCKIRYGSDGASPSAGFSVLSPKY